MLKLPVPFVVVLLAAARMNLLTQNLLENLPGAVAFEAVTLVAWGGAVVVLVEVVLLDIPGMLSIPLIVLF